MRPKGVDNRLDKNQASCLGDERGISSQDLNLFLIDKGIENRTELATTLKDDAKIRKRKGSYPEK